MAYGVATVLTNIEKAMVADRFSSSQTTYTAAPKYIAIGTGATAAGRTAAATDTVLSAEVESRTAGTESKVTTTVTGDTWSLNGTVTMTASRAIDEGGLFDAASGGNMALSWTQAVDNFNSGDSYTVTVRIVWL